MKICQIQPNIILIFRAQVGTYSSAKLSGHQSSGRICLRSLDSALNYLPLIHLLKFELNL